MILDRRKRGNYWLSKKNNITVVYVQLFISIIISKKEYLSTENGHYLFYFLLSPLFIGFFMSFFSMGFYEIRKYSIRKLQVLTSFNWSKSSCKSTKHNNVSLLYSIQHLSPYTYSTAVLLIS